MTVKWYIIIISNTNIFVLTQRFWLITVKLHRSRWMFRMSDYLFYWGLSRYRILIYQFAHFFVNNINAYPIFFYIRDFHLKIIENYTMINFDHGFVFFNWVIRFLEQEDKIGCGRFRIQHRKIWYDSFPRMWISSIFLLWEIFGIQQK